MNKNKQREIKFRAWDKLSKHMRYKAENSLILVLNTPEDFAVMQYTGFKDKNRKEIYEGDIIKIMLDDKPHYFDIKWNDAGWTINSSSVNYYEVVGNIYENKELLK